MSRRLQETYRQLLEAESGLSPLPWGGRLSVALVCPSTYHQGMSNLGVQMVYAMLNSLPATRCERFFLPPPGDLEEHRRCGVPLLSLETGRPIVDFDLIAFSISFENDYLNLPPLFDLLQIPLFRRERDDKYPLLLCGGVCAFLNPEPLAEVMDLFAIGEAEPILPAVIELLQSRCDVPRGELLDDLSALPGVYVPEHYAVDYDEDGLPSYRPVAGGQAKVTRQWARNIDQSMATSCILTPRTEFADMRLIEVSRGCPRACRFCAAGFIYRPFRQHSLEVLTAKLDEFTPVARTGLVAAAVTDSEALVQFGRTIQGGGGEVSVSSVRIDAISAAEVAMLADSGHKTLALAPEAGSQRLRDLLNKGIDEEQVLAAVAMIAQGGIPNLKLYFMVGLPGEVDEDVEAIVCLTEKIRRRWEEIGRGVGRLGRITLSVNPFVPKPWTPLQWAPMVRRGELEKKYRLLQKRLRTMPNVEMQCESLRAAEIQGLFARGDRRTARLLPLVAAGKGLKAACREAGLTVDFYLHRYRSEQEVFPWEVVDLGIDRTHLWREHQEAMNFRLGHPCAPGCGRCGCNCGSSVIDS